ncbi:MAG: Spy/CpxP family protein refolding chaperone [candidate division WOR-3 bacterium]|nr:MAG: Spy/CpxP family protein refolding chaperone [candidate division WOR-3 bacterium]
MNQKVITIILVISLAANLMMITAIGVFFLTSHREPPFKGPITPWAVEGHDWHKSHLKHRLNLTDAQIEAFNKQQEVIREMSQPIAEELKKKRRELIELLKDPDADSAQADFIFQEIVSLQTQLETMVFHNMAKMHTILTPEQRAELMNLVEKRHPPPLPHRMPHR